MRIIQQGGWEARWHGQRTEKFWGRQNIRQNKDGARRFGAEKIRDRCEAEQQRLDAKGDMMYFRDHERRDRGLSLCALLSSESMSACNTNIKPSRNKSSKWLHH